jgi:hypothetical protein
VTTRLSTARRALLPAPNLPLAYFAGAHVALGAAAAVLLVSPDLPGAFHYHPRMVAVVHLVTLGWISASILGAFYIVAPLALGVPFPARRADAAACVLFWAGTAGMVAGFWRGDYTIVAVASLAILAAILVVAMRALDGLAVSRVPFGVKLHVGLAFVNVSCAGALGVVLAAGRVYGLVSWSPLNVAAAHAHAAVLGWAAMMVVGLSYRLIPMFLPAGMPAGRGPIWSAVLLQAGVTGLAWALASGSSPLAWIPFVAAAFVVFAVQVRDILGNRRPRPVELRRRDWATWQTHAALLYLVGATVIGVSLAIGLAPVGWTWTYGVAGILGFVAQMVVGIQGRLLPLHAWYRAMSGRDGEPPPLSAHGLHSPRLSASIFLLWLAAVPALCVGLANGIPRLISGAAALLLIAIVIQAWHMTLIARRATASAAGQPSVIRAGNQARR